MSAPTYDPLADTEPELGRDGVRRDHYKRPLLVPIGGGPRKPYTSVTTLSDTLGDTRGLDRWDRRMIARGIGLDESLAALAAAEPYHTGLGERDEEAMKESGRRLDEIIERARDVAKAHQKRDWGTAFHGMTEPENRPYIQVPKRMQPAVASWWDKVAEYEAEIVATEVFVVNEEFGCAGTFDHLVRLPWLEHLIVLDKKSGIYHPEKTRIQLALYAGGVVYDKETDERRSFEEVYGAPVNQDIGITSHTPAVLDEGNTEWYEEPLEIGRRAAAAARWVREYLKENNRPRAKKLVKGEVP